MPDPFARITPTFARRPAQILRTGATVAGLLAAGTLGAQTVWTGASDTDWSNPANWNPAAVPGPDSTASVAGSAAVYSGELRVGGYGTGLLAISGQGVVTSTSVLLGYDTGASGTVTVTGAGSQLNTGFLKVGNFGFGTIAISAGGVVNATSAHLGYGSFNGPGVSGGNVTVTGTGSQLNLSDDSGTTLGIGAYYDYDALYYSTSSLTIADGAQVTVGSTGTRTIEIDRNSSLNIGAGGLSGTLLAGGIRFYTNSLVGAEGTTLATVAFNHTDALAFAVPISGNGQVTKAGSGTLTLSGANSYTGPTTISGGVLSVSDLRNGGTTSNLGASSSAAANLVLDGGALRYTGVARTTDRLFTLTANGGTLDASGTGAVNFNNPGAVALPGTGDRTLTFTGANTGSNTLAAIIADPSSGVTSLAKTGAGTWVLSGANTFTGGTTVSAGTLRATNAAALGAGASPLTLAGGTLQLANNSATAFNRPTTVAGNATVTSDRTSNGAGVTHTLGTLSIGAQTLSLAAGSSVTSGTAGLAFGATTLAGNATFSPAAGTALTLGAIGDGGGGFGFTKSGAGLLILTAAGTYTGGTTVSGGLLQISSDAALGSGGALTLDGGGIKFAASFSDLRSFTFGANGLVLDTGGFDIAAQPIVSASAGSFTKSGAGTLTFNAANSYAGPTIVTAGTLALGADGTLGSTTAALTLSGGTLDLGGHSATAGAVTFSGGTFANGTLSGASFDAQSGAIGGTLGGAGALAKSTASTVTLSGNNAGYTGAIAVNAGTLSVTHANALGATSAGTTVASGAAVDLNGVAVGAEPLSLGGTGIAGAGALTGTGTASLAGPVTLAANASIGGAGTLTLSGAIGESGGARTLAKVGGGTLVLSGDSTYTGLTTVSAGTLRLGAAGGAGSGPLGTPAAGTSVASGAVFDVNGFSLAAAEALTVNGTGIGSGGAFINSAATAATYAGPVTIGTASSSLGGSGDLTLAAGLLGNLAFAKVGAGTLTLAADGGARTGGVTVTAGTLALGHASALGASQTITLAGGTLGLRTDTSVTAYPVSLSASSTILSDKAAAGSAGLTHTLGTLGLGATTLTVGAGANVAADSAFGLTFGTTTLSGNPTFNVANNGTGLGTLTLGALAGVNTARTITKTGAGTLAFAATPSGTVAANSQLVVNAGTAQVGAAGALTGTNSFAVTVNATAAGGTAAFNLANVNQTIASLTFGGTGATATSLNSVATGTGTLTLGGGVTYNATNNPLGATLAGNLALGTAARTFTIGDSANAAADLTISAKITGTGGSNGLTKTGAGTLALTGAASSFGTLNVNAGALTVAGTGASTALNVTGPSTFTVSGTGASWSGGAFYADTAGTAVTVANAGAFTTSSAALDYGATATVTGSGSSWTNSGSLTLYTASLAIQNQAAASLGDMGLSVTYSDNVSSIDVSGGGQLTATALTIGGNGAATVTVGAASTLTVGTGGTGSVAIGANGTLKLGTGAAAGTLNAAGIAAAGGTVAFDQTGTLVFATPISGTGGKLTKTGAGTLILTGANTFTGATTVSAGTLQIGNGGATGSLTGAIVNQSALAFNRSNSLTYAGAITGTGSVSLLGGTLILTGANNYAGGTTISGGTLQIGNNAPPALSPATSSTTPPSPSAAPTPTPFPARFPAPAPSPNPVPARSPSPAPTPIPATPPSPPARSPSAAPAPSATAPAL